MSPRFIAPRSLGEAVDALSEPDAMPIAGGVAVGVLANLDLFSPDLLVSLAKIPELRGVSLTDDALDIGAAETHHCAAVDPLLRRELPELTGMFSRIGNVRVRAWGTVGGNLALAEPAQDPPVFLAALGAHVLTRGPAGTRRLPVAELSDGPMTTVLHQGELITRIVVPRLAPDERCAYLKFLPRTADDYATVSAAIRVGFAGGRIMRARLFCGGVGPVPVDCHLAADLLVGQAGDEPDVLDGLGAAVRDAVSPNEDHRGSADYKREMAAVFARRAVQACVRAA
jgi:CO/xanthine dehydrogenase FAD-binding subunit